MEINEVYRCWVCPQLYYKFEYLQYHLKQHHGIEVN